MTEHTQGRPRILLIDDVSENLHTLMNILREKYAIVAAKNGEKALEMAESVPQPDLILLDVKMPGMDGYSVLSHLKANPLTAAIPVIFVTALSDADDEAQGLALGVADYITKPVNPELLHRRIAMQLELNHYRKNPLLFDRNRPVDLENPPILLLVDDMADNIHFLVEGLKDKYRIRVANSGEKAIRMLGEESAPDLVLLDVVMPGMNGYEVCRQIKSMHQGNRIPVIFLSVASAVDDKLKGFEAGGADYVTKPFDIAEIEARIKTHLELSRLSACLEELVEQRTALLEKSEEKYQILAEYSPNWEYWMAADGSFLYVSPACQTVSGYAPEDFFGDAGLLDRIIHQDDLSAWREKGPLSHDSGVATLIFRIHTKDGGERWIEHTGNKVVREGGRPYGYRGSFRDISKRHYAEERLDFFINRDPLTTLPNRALFRELLRNALQMAERNRSQFALLSVDLDNIKTINASFGSSVGDQIIFEAAQRLKALFPQIDAIARTSGNKFNIVLEGSDNLHRIDFVGQRMVDELARPFNVDGHDIFVGPCLGIALYPADAQDAESLLNRAEAALHQAKNQGREAMCFFSPGMSSHSRERLALDADFRQAIQRDELVLYYQPQVDLISGKILSVEALIRWQHPQRGLVSPGEFIGLAEESGYILALGQWVLRKACSQFAAWLNAGVVLERVSVNVSSVQLARGNFCELVRKTLEETGLPAHRLELEITESCTLVDYEKSLKTLADLRDMGVYLAIDDFGTGYSSLAYIQELNVHKLKVDMAFVRDMTTNSANASIVKAVTALGHSLGLMVIAEGVEELGQARYLRSLQCDQIQGFLTTKPLPAEELLEFLSTYIPVQVPVENESMNTLLLVDDESSILSSLRRVLRGENYKILTAGSGEEALALLALHPVGVIVSDQRMPTMSGTDLLAKVRLMHPKTTRIVLSGYTGLDSLTEAINRGEIYRYLTKPWQNEELIEIIRSAFRRYADLVEKDS